MIGLFNARCGECFKIRSCCAVVIMRKDMRRVSLCQDCRFKLSGEWVLHPRHREFPTNDQAEDLGEDGMGDPVPV